MSYREENGKKNIAICSSEGFKKSSQDGATTRLTPDSLSYKHQHENVLKNPDNRVFILTLSVTPRVPNGTYLYSQS